MRKEKENIYKNQKKKKDLKVTLEKDSHMYFSQCEYRIWHNYYCQ
jgi:hypothetical protein